MCYTDSVDNCLDRKGFLVMNVFKKVTAVALAAAMLSPVASMTARAEEPRITPNPWNNKAMSATLYSVVPGDLQSGTLRAVTDGERWPEQPHDGNGTNPYAWTNYKSAQAYGIDETSSLIFEFSEKKQVASVVVYYFVDTWSASLPKSVRFFSIESGVPGEYSIRPRYSEQITSTCVKQIYDVLYPATLDVLELRFEADDTSLKNGNTRCVGVYEIELYDDNGENGVAYEPEPVEYIDDIKTARYCSQSVGSEETAHGKYGQNAIDCDYDTIWHTAWDGCAPEDRYIEISLDSPTNISGLRYLPRQGNKSGDNNGRVKDYEIYVGKIAWNGEIRWTKVATGTWKDDGEWKTVRFETVEDALYVKLVGVSTYGVKPDTWMSAAEIEFITTYHKWWRD